MEMSELTEGLEDVNTVTYNHEMDFFYVDFINAGAGNPPSNETIKRLTERFASMGYDNTKVTTNCTVFRERSKLLYGFIAEKFCIQSKDK